MIDDARAEQALRYLVATDESCAAAKAEMERTEFKAKAVKNAAFLHLEGTVAERNARAEVAPDYMKAMDEHFAAIRTYGAIANKRSTESIVMDTWRTVQANLRRG